MKKIKVLLMLFSLAFISSCGINTEESGDYQETVSETTAIVTEQQTSYAETILAGMTLEEKIGQMFFIRCPTEETESINVIEKYHPAGYILFAADFKNTTPDEAKDNIAYYQSVSKLPMLIGVDEEGGTVNRISKYSQHRETPFLSPQELYLNGGFDNISDDTIQKAEFLKSYGINVNLAPVADISVNKEDYINARSLGMEAGQTAEYVKTVVNANKANGMESVLKHFPGYGDNADTHTGIAVDGRPLENFRTSDFIPFKAGIEAGANAVLVNHNIVNSIDERYPSSLSLKAHEILRSELEFDGVIMTDDLMMDAIAKYTYGENYAVLAVKAGNDLLIDSNYAESFDAVLTAVQSGEIPESRINESVIRVLNWKISMGILNE